MRKLVPALVAASVFGAATVPPVAAQQERAAAPRVFVRGDSVFIYHGARPSARTGVNIYRRAAGSTEWVRLTAEPLKAVEDPARLREYLGPDMEAVRAALGERDAQAVLVRLRIDRAAAAMLGRLYPGVARALGQLHIDTTAAPGTQVSYRVEVVDGRGGAWASRRRPPLSSPRWSRRPPIPCGCATRRRASSSAGAIPGRAMARTTASPPSTSSVSCRGARPRS